MAKKKRFVLIEIVLGEKDLKSIKKEARAKGLELIIRKSGKEGRSTVYVVKGFKPQITQKQMPISRRRMPNITPRLRKKL